MLCDESLQRFNTISVKTCERKLSILSILWQWGTDRTLNWVFGLGLWACRYASFYFCFNVSHLLQSYSISSGKKSILKLTKGANHDVLKISAHISKTECCNHLSMFTIMRMVGLATSGCTIHIWRLFTFRINSGLSCDQQAWDLCDTNHLVK